MEPVISPWIFYWIDLLSSFQVFSVLSACMLSLILIASVYIVLEGNSHSNDIEVCKKINRIGIQTMNKK